MVKRSRITVVQPAYKCPYCHKKFYNYLDLFKHVRYRHGVFVLTDLQYRILLVCRKLTANGREWFSLNDVYDEFTQMFRDVNRSRLRDKVKWNLHSLARKGLLEMKREHDTLLFRVRG